MRQARAACEAEWELKERKLKERALRQAKEECEAEWEAKERELKEQVFRQAREELQLKEEILIEDRQDDQKYALRELERSHLEGICWLHNSGGD